MPSTWPRFMAGTISSSTTAVPPASTTPRSPGGDRGRTQEDQRQCAADHELATVYSTQLLNGKTKLRSLE